MFKLFDINNFMIGIDEVGRGPLAGPSVVCGIVLGDQVDPYNLIDSKKLKHHQIETIGQMLLNQAKAIYIEYISVEQIEALGIKQAIVKAMQKITTKANQPFTCVDFEKVVAPYMMLSAKKGDTWFKAVSGASIVAKCVRDRYMRNLAAIYPEFGFEQHVGYGTKHHLQALEIYGYVPGVHRNNFAPIKTMEKIYEVR